MSISQNYPNTSPALLIDLSNTQKLDPRIAFSRASTGTFYDANGLLRTAPDNVARFQFDPVTGVSEGLLRENQATNLFTRSEEFDNASWTKTNATVTANTIVAPDGTLTGDVIVETTANGVHACSQTPTASASTPYTVSVYFNRGSNSRNGYIQANNNIGGTGGAVFAWFDLDAGTASAVTDLVAGFTSKIAKITDVGGNWYRCELTFTTVTSTTSLAIFTGVYNGARSYTGDGVSGIGIWGAQVETNTYPTSYIKTVASQVTRAADTARLTNVDAYNTAEFTAVSKPFGVSGVSATQTVLNGDVPIERLYVYPRNLPQDQINTLVENDGWWAWRIVGSDFALPNFTTNGTVIVDWGDGTVGTLTTAVHTFANASPHTVRFRMGSGTTFRPNLNGNATHVLKIVAVGSAPSNMIVDCSNGLRLCTNLKSIDATLIGSSSFFNAWAGCTGLTSFPYIDTSSGTDFQAAWNVCSSLTSFPLIDTGLGTNFLLTWSGGSSLTSFPAIDTSSGTNFSDTWNNCNKLTSFPLLDMSAATDLNECWDTCTSLTSFPAIDFPVCTNFTEAWRNCSSLTSFPLVDTSAGTTFTNAWNGCSSLTSFPVINTALGTGFESTWRSCSSLTSFPLINISIGTNFRESWRLCTALTDFPASFFDLWTGVPVANCFQDTWTACNALTTTSVENILVSIDTSGVSAPATGTEITISYNVVTGALTTPTTVAITALKLKNWTIRINGVLQ